MGNQTERIRSKAVAGGPSKVADCGAGWERQQLADQWGDDWWNGWSHIHMWISREEQLGSEIDPTTQGSRAGK